MNIIRDLRKKKGWTQEELGKKLGLSNNAISGYEKGNREPSIELLGRMADLFGVSIDAILGREDDRPDPGWKTVSEPNDPRFPPKYLPADPLPDLDREMASIPILGSVRAGYDNYCEENREGFLAIDDRLKAMHPEAYVLNVKGDSMEPEICHGDMVICLPDVEVRNNDVAIVCINGDIGTVKRVRFEDNGLTLIPANPSYKKLHYSAEDVRSYPVTVQSKVVEVRHKYH